MKCDYTWWPLRGGALLGVQVQRSVVQPVTRGQEQMTWAFNSSYLRFLKLPGYLVTCHQVSVIRLVKKRSQGKLNAVGQCFCRSSRQWLYYYLNAVSQLYSLWKEDWLKECHCCSCGLYSYDADVFCGTRLCCSIFLLHSEFGLKKSKSFSSCRIEFIHGIESYISHFHRIEFLSGHTILCNIVYNNPFP